MFRSGTTAFDGGRAKHPEPQTKTPQTASIRPLLGSLCKINEMRCYET